MSLLGSEEKKISLVATGDENRMNRYLKMANAAAVHSVVYTATDGVEALFKIENAPPHVLLVDMELPKLDAIKLATEIFSRPNLQQISVVIVSPLPDQDHFVDKVLTGQVQFVTDLKETDALATAFTRALNRPKDGPGPSYKLKILNKGEVLFVEGEIAQCVYIVRRGELQAFKGMGAETKILGLVSPGEFVGEMAIISGEPRSATVQAMIDCELIEIPMGSLDTVLFSKPLWAKALVTTLSKRLKKTNNALADKINNENS